MYNALVIPGALYFFLFTLKRSVMSEMNYVKQETFEQMKHELHHMKSVERPAASKAIAEAREKGDLKENAEYDAAKDDEATNNDRILKIQDLLNNCTIVEDEENNGKLGLGGHADIKFLDTDEVEKVCLVSTVETNPEIMAISIESPLGIAIYKKPVGEKCVVVSPEGNYEVIIEKIY